MSPDFICRLKRPDTHSIYVRVKVGYAAEFWPFAKDQRIEFIDAGDTIVVLGKYSGKYKATGKSFQANFAHVWRAREGRAFKFKQYTDTLIVQKALQE